MLRSVRVLVQQSFFVASTITDTRAQVIAWIILAKHTVMDSVGNLMKVQEMLSVPPEACLSKRRMAALSIPLVVTIAQQSLRPVLRLYLP